MFEIIIIGLVLIIIGLVLIIIYALYNLILVILNRDDPTKFFYTEIVEAIKDIIFWWQMRHIRRSNKRFNKVRNQLLAIMTVDKARALLMLEPLGVDYLMYNGVPIGAEKQAEAVVAAVERAVKARRNVINL